MSAPLKLPAGWVSKPLSRIAEVKMGRQRSPKHQSGPYMRPYLRAANIKWKGLDLNEVLQMNFDPPEYDLYRLVQGDILVTEASGSASEVGRPAIWNGEIDGCCYQNTLIRVRAPKHLQRFLYLHLLADAQLGHFAEVSHGVGIHHLTSRILSDWLVKLPREDEQRRIVDAIESNFVRLDDATANVRAVKRSLALYRRSLLTSACSGALIEADASKWEKAKVGDLITSMDYGTSARCNEEPSGIPVLRMGNLIQGRIDYSDLKYLPQDHDEFPRLYLEAGDVLFNRTNSPELVGKTAVYKGERKPCSFASYLLRVQLGPRMLPDFLSYCTSSPLGRSWVKSVVVQQVGQANVSGSKFRAFEIPVPPLNEQEKIVAEVEKRICVVEDIEREAEWALNQAARLRKSILTTAFEGRLSVERAAD